MQKQLLCVCCGNKITINNRYCPDCGQNNDDYVEVVEEKKSTTSTPSIQPINKLPITPVISAKTKKSSLVNAINNSNQLSKFDILFNIIEPLKDARLKEYVRNLEEKFIEQDELFYFYCGKFLERMLKKIKYSNKSTSFERKQTTHEMFCLSLDSKFYARNIEYEFLKSKNIYNDWVRKYTKKDGTEFSSFKADLTDILLKTNLIDSSSMYPSFIDDAFNLYSLRTSVNHDDDNSINIGIEEEKIDSLIKVVIVLFEQI